VPDGPVSLERIERLEDVRKDWSRLAQASGHPFATWEWNSRWWSRFGEGRSLYCFGCRDAAGDLIAILPLYVAASRPIRVARFLGYADLQSPICAPENRAAAASAMLEATASGRGGCRLIVAEHLPGDQGWGELLGRKPFARHPDPVLWLKGKSWDDYLGSRSRNFRQQVRRRERRLVEEHGLSFRLADDPQRLADDVETLFRLHRARWGEESTGVFFGERAEFHRDFASDALGAGWLRLWIAEIGGEPVAAWYGWRFAGSEWYYQAGRVPEYDRLSLGFVMLAHTVREAFESGVRAYRFLAGAEDYKWRFAEEDLSAESLLLGTGAAARASMAAVRMAGSLPAPLRRRVIGIAG
jgi:CelD/BcsL family acetyltransferase involved in cellulose biosynthesis